jgi:hypothetical protein
MPTLGSNARTIPSKPASSGRYRHTRSLISPAMGGGVKYSWAREKSSGTRPGGNWSITASIDSPPHPL